jgi:hypothetical protein
MLGDRVRVTSINIQNNILSIDAFTQGPSDPMSSPSQKIHTTYTLQNDTLVAGEQQIIATGLPQFSDPFAYCAAMGTVDGTEGHYSGPPMTEPIARALIKATGGQESAESLKAFMSNSVFRCVDGQVVACTVGANLPCMDKLNLDQTPAQALLDFCSANSTSDSIPMAVTGHNSAYEWACKDAKPFIVKQIAEPDAQGFTKGIWYPIPPQ